MNAPYEKGVDYTYQGMTFFYNGHDWTRIPLPDQSPLHDIFIESPERIWMVGFNGRILLGNVTSGFRNLAFAGDTQTLLSFTKFRDRYVVASETALYWFEGHSLQPFRPAPLPGKFAVLKVQAVDDVLFLFCYREGVFRFDGTAWEPIPIPPELLERDFKGLRR